MTEAGIRHLGRMPAFGVPHAHPGSRQNGPVVAMLMAYWAAFQAIFYLLATFDRAQTLPANPMDWLAGLLRYMTQPVELAICALGAAVCFAIYAALGRFAAHSLKIKIVVALAASLAASFVFALANTYELALGWTEVPGRPYWIELTRQVFLWLAPFGFWTGLAMAVTHGRLLQSQQLRLASLQIEAQQAKLQALSYQLSPHFLFNTLNSISWMIWEKEWQGAERMIVNFSEFLRTTLMLDPAADVPLRAEIDLQRKYLSVEEVRFSDRLRVTFTVPPELEPIPVPALILQPLVENAVRHAVSPSSQPVHLTIAAERLGETLILTVQDDGTAGPGLPGSGLGLANVRDRLRARYGERGGFDTVRGPAGFRATLRIPLT